MKRNIYFVVVVCLCLIMYTGCKKKKTDTPVLNPVSMITSTVEGNEITILWGEPNNSKPNNYKIYRNDEFYQTSSATSFKETVFEAGTYRYCVSAVYPEGESKKSCTDAIVTDVPTEDYAQKISGIYVGDIVIPEYEETYLDKTIALNYKSFNFVTVAINDTISPMGFNVPLNLNEDVMVLSTDSSYTFSFSTTTSIEFSEQFLTFPLLGEGIIVDNNFVLKITVQTGVAGDIVGTFTGLKQ